MRHAFIATESRRGATRSAAQPSGWGFALVELLVVIAIIGVLVAILLPAVHPDPVYAVPIGKAWISGWTLVGNAYMHVMPPGQRSCHLYGGEDDGANLVTAASAHPGGLHLLSGDGHVAFVAEDVERAIWWALGSRDGGEGVGATPL